MSGSRLNVGAWSIALGASLNHSSTRGAIKATSKPEPRTNCKSSRWSQLIWTSRCLANRRDLRQPSGRAAQTRHLTFACGMLGLVLPTTRGSLTAHD